jgi:hypothetical protein
VSSAIPAKEEVRTSYGILLYEGVERGSPSTPCGNEYLEWSRSARRCGAGALWRRFAIMFRNCSAFQRKELPTTCSTVRALGSNRPIRLLITISSSRSGPRAPSQPICGPLPSLIAGQCSSALSGLNVEGPNHPSMSCR